MVSTKQVLELEVERRFRPVDDSFHSVLSSIVASSWVQMMVLIRKIQDKRLISACMGVDIQNKS